MDEDQIFELIGKCKHLKYIFVGINAADNFPLELKPDNFIIVNTAKANAPGQHWILLGTTSYPNRIYYADPLGFSISFYNDVFSRLQSKEGISIINIMQGKEPLQKLNSQMCGPFCICIAHYLYNKLFFEIPQVNEVNLLTFLRHMFS